MGEKSIFSKIQDGRRLSYSINYLNTKLKARICKAAGLLIDIFPTLIDHCRLSNKLNEKGADLGGHSLRPLIEDPENGIWLGPKGALSVIVIMLKFVIVHCKAKFFLSNC